MRRWYSNCYQEENADSYSVIQTIKTQNRARTMALDTKTHKIYLSVAETEPNSRKALPGTFKILVYEMK